jgi:hypothetical protein
VKEVNEKRLCRASFSRRRAFASTLIAALALALVSGFAAVVLVSSSQQRALLSSFEARKASNHFSNAVFFFNDSLRDALLDYEFSSSGCPSQPASKTFPQLGEEYLTASAQELSSSGVYADFSNLVVQISPSGRVQPAAGFDDAFIANASFDLFAAAGSAFKNESVFLERRIEVNYTGVSHPLVQAWKANFSGSVVTVNCGAAPP